MANNNATTTRPVNGGNGDDVLAGDDAANVISGGSGHDTLTGGGGDDVLKGDAGRDLLDGGAGSDRVDGHSEDDVLVYVAAENAGAHDQYDGGAGVDTLRLVLTREEWMRPAVQSDIAAFLAFIADPNPSGQATAGTFAFTAFDLKAGKFERLEVTVDGVALDPRDEAVTPAPDAAQTDEDGTAAGAVLANDAVPDLVRSVEVVVAPAHGTLVFNADGTYVYTPGAYFNPMAAGETATETFQYRVTDAAFDSAIALVTLTITGTNDGPVVANSAMELIGAVQEDGPLTAAGQLSASDVDHNATQTWTVEGAATGSYGSIAVDANGHWLYTLDNAAHQDLAQGESHEETFTIRVTDDQGAFVDQVVTVDVAGTNDGPVITGGATSGSVTEDAAATQARGQLVADDPDHGAQQIWTVVGGTPSGSADYLFTMDRLTVTRNGQPYFADEFSDGVPPPSGVGPFSYVGATLGGLAESGGRLVFDGADAMPFVGVGTPDPIVGASAVLRTNIDPASPSGLKSSTDFTVSGVFDLVEPDSPRETYGIRLTDRLVGGPGTPPDQLGDNAIEVRVIGRTDGTTVVAFRHLDFVSDTATLLQAIPLAAPPGADQIRINLAHAVANVGQVAASFEYLSGGVVVGSQAFTATGLIFQGENWTRAEVIASAPAMNDSTLGGSYGTLTVAQNGAWTYDIDNGRAATQALAQGQVATDSFTVRVADEFGAFDTRTIAVQVTGTNDGPVIQTADVARALAEDANVVAAQLTATGEGQFSDVDLTDSHSMNAVLAAAQLSNGAPLPAGLAAALGGAMTTTLLDAATGDGHAQYRWDFGVDNAATQFLAAGQTLQATYEVVATDSHGASAAQQVTITITGANDAPVVTVGDVTAAVVEAIVPAGNLGDSGSLAFTDADLGDVHSVGVVTPSAGALGTLTAAVAADTTGSGTGGSVAWQYGVDAAAVEYLAAGQTRQESFTFAVADGQGGSVARTVTATITGTNDAPVIAAADTEGAVTALPAEPDAPPPPLVFTVQQFLNYQSHNLATLRNYVASHAADYTVQTSVIDYTDDPGGFAGELPGSSPWPAAQAQNVSGTGGINNVFFARITADFSVAAADTYTFRTFNDDGVFLLIDNQLIIQDTGYHPEAPFTGSIALQPGNHTIELFFYENGGEASLEFSARSSTGSFGLVGASGGGLGGANVPVRDSGTIAFTDVDLTDAHVVSAAPVGATLGTLAVAKDSDTTGTGTGGQLTWTYSVGNAALGFLAAGETRTESFLVTLDDQHGGVVTRQVGVTVTGSNDDPVVAAADLTGAVTEMIAPADNLTDSGTIAFADLDLADVHSVGTVTPSPAALGALTAAVSSDTTGTGTGGVVTWNYTVPASALEYLGAGQTRVETFAFDVLDGAGGSVARTVSVTLTGTNDVPIVATADVTGAVTEMIAPAGLLANSGTIAFSDADLADVHSVGVVTASAPTLGTLTASVTADTTGSGAGGVVTWNYSVPASSVEYLGANQTRVESFTFDVLDGKGGSVPRTVSVTITGTNDKPVAVGDVLAAAEDTPVMFTAAQLLGNDSDADANAQLSIESVTSGVGGTVVRNLDGSVTFKPFSNFTGAANFSYVASDGSALSNPASVTVNVAPVNDAPALSVPLSGATSMWNGEGNAVDLIGGNNGTLYNGTSFGAGHIGQAFSFDGANDFARVLNQIPNDFTISAWINTSNTSRTGTQFHHGDGLIYADVGGVTTDFGISILNNRVAFGTGGTQDITIQSQSTVTTGDWVQFSAVRSGSVISLYVNGVLEASADTGYAGPLGAPTHINFGGNTIDSRYYRGLLDDVTIYDRALSVAEIQSLVAGQPAITTAEDTPRTMTAIRVSDVDAGADSVLVSLAAGHGALALGSSAGLALVDGDGSDGSLSFTGSLAAVNAALASGLTYAPDADWNGADQLSLAVNDQGHNGAGGALAATQNVAITVTPVNDAPVAVDDANTLTVKALPSGAQSNFVNWVNWTSAAPGSVVGTIDLGGGQTIGVTYSGEFAFAQTNGGTNFYTDYDNNGSPTTTTYTSPAVQNGPTGSDIIALSQATQKTLTFSQPVNDLFFAIVSLNGNGYLFDQDFDVMSYGQGFFGNGTATRVALPDGRFSVVGSGELHGVLRIDGAVQSLTWTSQTPEYWNGFTVGTYGKAQTATAAGNLLSNDSDADGNALAVSAVNGQPIVGNSVTLDLASGARVQVNKDGTYLYDEDGAFGPLGAGQSTVDSFQYTVSDGQGGSATATARITVTGVNDAATIGDPTVTAVTEDVGVNGAGNLVASGTIPIADPDAGQAAFVTSVVAGPGSLGSLQLAASGAYTYTVANALVQSLAAGQTRTDTFTVQAAEGTTKTVSFTVNGANDAPAIAAPQMSVASTNFDEVASGEPYAVSLNGGVWRTNDAAGVVEVNPGGAYGLSNGSNVIELERTTFSASDLYTDVAAGAGQFFRLDFDYAARAGLDGASSAFDVYWNNVVVAQFTPSGQSMQHYALALSAPAAGTYRLEFQGNTGDGDGGGALLDNIGLAKINAVVEMGTPAGNLVVNGTLAISDVDLADTHGVTATALAPALGTLTPVLMPDTTGSGAGAIQWTYSVAASAVEYLAAGQLRVEAFNIALNDGHGGVATQQVEVTIIGTAG